MLWRKKEGRKEKIKVFLAKGENLNGMFKVFCDPTVDDTLKYFNNTSDERKLNKFKNTQIAIQQIDIK